MVRLDCLPVRGGCSRAESVAHLIGGRGARQAMAASRAIVAHRLRADVHLLSLVGDDDRSQRLLYRLSASGVNCSAIHQRKDTRTGVCVVLVEKTSEHTTVFVPGAERFLTESDVVRFFDSRPFISHLLVTLDSPSHSLTAAMQRAKENGAKVILDPAPQELLVSEIVKMADILTPNAAETAALLGLPPSDVVLEHAKELTEQLCSLGPHSIVLKFGKKGAWIFHDDEHEHVRCDSVGGVANSVGAGDVLSGTLAALLVAGVSFADAARLAVASATDAVRQGCAALSTSLE